METTKSTADVNPLSPVKSFRVVIANDPNYFTSEKYNKVINGFTTEEVAANAALAAVEEIAKDISKGAIVVYSETLNAFVVWSGKGYYGRVILITAKVEEVETTPTTPETETTTNTEPTMATTDTTDNAPKFEELTHAATNIVLTAENDGDIYRRYVEQLVNSLAKKVAKGVQLNAATLAASSVVANIVRESIKGMKLSGWTSPVTASDRKQAATYLASVYISDAIENAEYINA